MRKIVAGLSATAVGLGVALLGPAAQAQAGAAPTEAAARQNVARRAADVPQDVAGIVWKRCEQRDLKELECGTLSVPLDHDDPSGRKITIALTRKRHTVPESRYRGILLMNPGGPGGSGLGLPTGFAGTPAAKAAAAYDVIGFDPRGVGASKPNLKCVPEDRKALPYSVPDTAEEERFWLNRAERIARNCAKRFGWMLPYMRTEDSARDMDYERRQPRPLAARQQVRRPARRGLPRHRRGPGGQARPRRHLRPRRPEADEGEELTPGRRSGRGLDTPVPARSTRAGTGV